MKNIRRELRALREVDGVDTGYIDSLMEDLDDIEDPETGSPLIAKKVNREMIQTSMEALAELPRLMVEEKERHSRKALVRNRELIN